MLRFDRLMRVVRDCENALLRSCVIATKPQPTGLVFPPASVQFHEEKREL